VVAIFDIKMEVRILLRRLCTQENFEK